MSAALLAPEVPPRRRLVSRILMILVLLGVAVVLLNVFHSPALTIQVVEVEHQVSPDGAPPRTSAAEIRHMADIRLGRPIWRSLFWRSLEGVERHPWVESAEIRRELPGTIRILVKERQPVILLQSEGLYHVDVSGEVFKRARSGDLDYPVLTGLRREILDLEPLLARRVIRESIQLLDLLQEEGVASHRDVSELSFNELDGFSVVLRNGGEIAFGFADPVERLGRLHRLVRAGLDLSHPQIIDLAPETVAVAAPLPASPGNLDVH